MLHPWAIAVGLLAATLPVLIHWLTRPKPARLPLSTLRFVRDLVEERRALWRLRDALVLLLRTAAIGLLAAAIATVVSSGAAKARTTDTADVTGAGEARENFPNPVAPQGNTENLSRPRQSSD